MVKKIAAVRAGFWCLLAISFIASVDAESGWDWFEIWDSVPLDRLWTVNYGQLDYAADWPADPAILYLSFQERSRYQGYVLTTLLHPKKRPSTAYESSFMPGREQDAEAFGFRIVRVSTEGYEVGFQRIDAITGRPLPLRETVVMFPRVRRTLVPLSDTLTVVGSYETPPFSARQR